MPRKLFSLTICLVVGLFANSAFAARAVPLNIKVIQAHSKNKEVDPKLKDLVKEFAKLTFTGYQLKDEATLSLEAGAAGRMQLPDGEWMVVTAKEMTGDDKLRLELSVDKLKFKSTVTIAAGATLAVIGPAFADGSLILAVSRLSDTRGAATP